MNAERPSVRPGPLAWLGRRRRLRLARAVRKQADLERARTALYEAIAARVEDADRPPAAEGLERLRHLLAEGPPLADYGPFARTRDARVASILADLDPRRARPA